jgi:hypothetical protein
MLLTIRYSQADYFFTGATAGVVGVLAAELAAGVFTFFTFFTCFFETFAVFTAGVAAVVAGAGVAGVCATIKLMLASAKASVPSVVFIFFLPAGFAARSQFHTALPSPNLR